jgi:hypothetical protein
MELDRVRAVAALRLRSGGKIASLSKLHACFTAPITTAAFRTNRKESPTQHDRGAARERFPWLSVWRPAGESATTMTSPIRTFTEDDMMKKLLAFVLAGALMAPTTGLTSESAFRDEGTGQAATKFPEKLPLPPIAHLETMPWMNFDFETKGLKVDTLLPPSFVVPAFPKNSAFANNDVFNTRQLLAGTGLK